MLYMPKIQYNNTQIHNMYTIHHNYICIYYMIYIII